MKTRSLRAIQFAFLWIGVLALGYWLAVTAGGWMYEFAEKREFSRVRGIEASLTSTAPAAKRIVATKSHAPAEGSVVGRLTIPRLNLSILVVEGDKDRDLRLASGHIPGTSLPGETGNSAIAGHRDTFFRPLRHIREGDAITVTTLDGQFVYRVKSTQVVSPGDIQVLYPTEAETLTLVTCYPFSFIGPAPKRFIVSAERVRTPESLRSVVSNVK
jgi:sortase A